MITGSDMVGLETLDCVLQARAIGLACVLAWF